MYNIKPVELSETKGVDIWMRKLMSLEQTVRTKISQHT